MPVSPESKKAQYGDDDNDSPNSPYDRVHDGSPCSIRDLKQQPDVLPVPKSSAHRTIAHFIGLTSYEDESRSSAAERGSECLVTGQCERRGFLSLTGH
jgi:hypothetical protein